MEKAKLPGGKTITEPVILKLGDSEILIPRDRRLKKVILELSSRCNLECPMCFRSHWSEKTGDMDIHLLYRILSEASLFPHLSYIHFIGMGEPFCNDHVREALKAVKTRGLQVRITSNGTMVDRDMAEFLVKEKVDILDISLEMENIPWRGRTNTLDRGLEALEIIRKARERAGSRKPEVRIAVVLTEENVEEVIALAEKLKGKGVSQASFSNILPMDSKADLMRLYPVDLNAEQKLTSRLFLPYYRIGIKTEIPRFALSSERHCSFILGESTFVRWDGKVSPCMRLAHSYDEWVLGRKKEVIPYFFGDLEKDLLSSIWDKKEYVAFRWRLRRALYASCLDCNLLHVCEYPKTTESDCWGDTPACSDCLWDRNLIRCPV